MLNAYWEYAGTRYKHKYQAIQSSGKHYKDIKFTMFTDDTFNKLDWTIEPAQSLKSLMLTRALQLRETYKYIKFFFSGGADSTTVLNVFLDNNIPIDEIIVIKFFENNQSNYEVDNFTIPYLKSIEQQLHPTKIKIYTIYENYFEEYLSDKWFFTRSSLSPRHYNLPNIKGKNYCNLMCGLDPYIEIIDGKPHATFYDTHAANELASFRNVELFYTSPDLPELHVKQCHILKKHIRDDSIDYQKEMIKKHLRDAPVAPEPDFFKLTFDYKVFMKKDRFLFRGNDKFLDKWRYILNTRINGTPVFRLPVGFCQERYNLG